MNILTDILGLAKRRMFAKQVFPSDVMVIGINKDPDMTGVASPIPYKHCKLIRFRDLKVNYNLVLDSNCPEIALPGEGQIFWKQEPDPSTNIMTNYFRSIRSLSPGILNINISPDDCYVELTCLAEANLAANVGSGVGIWKDKVGVVLNFKSLLAGDGIQITDGLDEITITSLAMQTLTTIGTTGASTLVGTTLNIPIYQGQITLTTIGTTGVSTLIGDVLNIPTYQGEITLTNLGPYGNATLIGDVLNIPTYDLSLTTNGVSGASTLTVDALGNDVLNIPIYVPDGLTAMTSFTIEGNSGVTLTMDNLDQLDIVGQGTTANPLSTDYYGINTVTTIVSPTNSKVQLLLSDTPVVPGEYTTPNLTVNQQGQIITIEDGTSCSLILNDVCDCSLPNETDVYVMIDTTSGPYNPTVGSCYNENIEQITTAVNLWHTNFSAANPNYTGKLYVYKYGTQGVLNSEDYLNQPNQILKGYSGTHCSGTTDFVFLDNTGADAPVAPNQFVPLNWSNSATPSASWVPPTELLYIAFINESAHHYHGGGNDNTTTNVGTISFNSNSNPAPGAAIIQPTTSADGCSNWTDDLNLFDLTINPALPTDPHFTFFRGVVYPACPNTPVGNVGFSGDPYNFLLHAYGATTCTQTIEKTAFQTAVGPVNYAAMTTFDSSFDADLTAGITNPYWNSDPAVAKGLWNRGWVSILDKSSITASPCPNLTFTAVNFSKELDNILGIDCDCVSLVDSWDSRTCELGLRSIKSCSLDITVDDGCINIEEKGICFEDSNTINFKSNNGIITAFVQDTDWHPLNGFDWYYYAGPDFLDPTGDTHPSVFGGRDDRPHARRIGNQIHFRGAAIVPLENDAVTDALPWDYNIAGAQTNTYSKTARTAPYTGGAASSSTSFNGVVVNNDGQITFNREQEFIPNAVLPLGMHIDSTVVHPLQMTGRYISAYTGTPPAFSTVGSVLSTTVRPMIAMDGNTRILKLQAIRDQEQSAGNQSTTSYGTSIWNNMNTHVKAGDYFAQYGRAETTMAGAPDPSNVLTNVVGATGTTLQFNGAVQPLQLTYLTTHWYPVDFDGGDVEKLGGIFMQLDGMTAFISPCADLIPTPQPCEYPESYNYCNGRCLDPGTGTGIYSSLNDCLDAGCYPVTATNILNSPTVTPMSFSLSIDCSGPTQVVNANNIQGGIGPYEWGGTTFATYQDATQNTNWTPGTSIAYGVANNATYYVALRDSSNPQNIVVLDAVVNCTPPAALQLSFMANCETLANQNGCSIIPQIVLEAQVTNGVAPYEFATSVFLSQQDAQNNSSWEPSTSNTSYYYHGSTSQTNSVWMTVRDSSGTQEVMEIPAQLCGCDEPVVSYGTAAMAVTARVQDTNPLLPAANGINVNGKASVDTVTNAIAPISYLWSTVGDNNCSTDSCLNNLPLGPIMVKVTDSTPGTPNVVYMHGFVLINVPDETTGACVSNGLQTWCCGSDMTVSDETEWNSIVAQNGSCTPQQSSYCTIPDEDFRNAIDDAMGAQTWVNTNQIALSTVNVITSLNVASKNIHDLTGIECFTALTTLYCYSNQLTSLDVSQNTALDYLHCSDNQLTSLDVSQNTALTKLYCYNNQITSLNVSTNTALTELWCYTNEITSLDVSLNTALNRLQCGDNQLNSLDVRNGNNTNFVSFLANNNTNLTCIEVDDASWSTTNWTNIDTWASFSNTNC